jgi:hypothetical protein
MTSNSVRRYGKKPDYICKVKKDYPGSGSITTLYAYFKQERILCELAVYSSKTGGRHVPGRWKEMAGVEPARFLEVIGNHSADGSLKYAGTVSDN